MMFEELDYRPTRMGTLVLQRRRVAALGEVDAYEVKLGDEYLMSSLFHEAEEAMSRLALEWLEGEGPFAGVVGGLGLGYTAAAALADDRVRELRVVEALEAVVDWHRQGIVPNGEALTRDARCRCQAGDFFAMAGGGGFDPDAPGRRFDFVLLDIDHSPRQVLDPSHAAFYTEEGLRGFTRFLRPGGVFALWSNDPPEADVLARLEKVFDRVEGRVVSFDNPLAGGRSTNGVYLARLSPGGSHAE